MTLVATIVALFREWADVVAGLILGAIDRVRPARIVRVIERQDGGFWLCPDARQPDRSVAFDFAEGRADGEATVRLLRGSRIEIVLSARNFLFRTLELPLQAAGFAEGIVRAQIDRLSPWTVSTALFGCSAPVSIDATRMATSVSIMPRAAAEPLLRAALEFRPVSVALFAEPETPDNTRVKIFEQKASALLDRGVLGRLLLIGLAVISAAALVCFVGAQFVAERFDQARSVVAQQIGQSQMQLRAGGETPQGAAIRMLERQKFETPTMTLMLEALTRALPDHTYLTELHVVGNKLQIVGTSRDAPSLIRAIEQTPSFARATFFAPTTRGASDVGEQFHIEARLESKGAPR